MLTAWTIVTAAITSSVQASLKERDTSPLFDKKFDNQVAELLDFFHVPGLSVGIVHGDHFESKGYGYARLPSAFATADTLYYTGSTTKAFVATIAAMMVEDNTKFSHIKWSTPLASLLNGDFALSQEYESFHTTLEDALSHRSGLPRHDPSYGWNNASNIENVRRMRYLPLSAEPRTRWQYCNTMFGAVGAMIERQTGLALESILKKWIWQPLGMNSTCFADPDSGRVARGYFWQGEHYVPEKYTDLSGIAGAGATISSVDDYSLWMKALLDASGKKTKKGSPMTNKIWRDITGSRSIVNPKDIEPFTDALGWIVGRIGEHTVVTHGGGLNGFGTNLFLIPDLKLGFVSMGNTMGTAAEVGGVLFNILLKKLDPEIAELVEETKITGLHELVTGVNAFAGIPQTHLTSFEYTPLPGLPEDYVGLYEHPGYGIYNITLISSDENTDVAQQPLLSNPQIKLRIEPSTRLWPTYMTLAHRSHTFFDMDLFFVSGPIENEMVAADCGRVGTVVCKNEVAYDPLGSLQAAFDFSLSTGRVERLGVQIEPEMMRYAEEMGGKENWREGMIWFTKL